jgi:hypothetical protein
MRIKMLVKWRDEHCKWGLEKNFEVNDEFTLKVLRTHEKRYCKKERVVIKFYFYLADEWNNVEEEHRYDTEWEIMLEKNSSLLHPHYSE